MAIVFRLAPRAAVCQRVIRRRCWPQRLICWSIRLSEIEAQGRRARRQVEVHFSLEHYVHRLTPLVRSGQEMRVAIND